jgi:hypothetical protein
MGMFFFEALEIDIIFIVDDEDAFFEPTNITIDNKPPTTAISFD